MKKGDSVEPPWKFEVVDELRSRVEVNAGQIVIHRNLLR